MATRKTTGIARWLSMEEVAMKLSCSRRHAYNLAADGAFAVTNIARGSRPKLRVREQDVETYIKRRKCRPGAIPEQAPDS